MCELVIRGVPVRFPFEPYDIQRVYMERVIQCLQQESNGVLESPTGTGKTLSLLCSSLAWIELKKAQVQAQRQMMDMDMEGGNFMQKLQTELEMGAGPSKGVAKSGRAFLGLPTIIYASRTHSQLTQAMQELKRSSYGHMKACVLGSREQMCIHPEVAKERDNSVKIHMCRLKVKTRSCNYHNRVEKMKEDATIRNMNVIDIEDIVKLGESNKFCPYYMSKELTQQADIIFMPYNYLFYPRLRNALGVELQNNIVILDEAHNVDKMCEESASIQIKSTDVTLCIEEITAVMKMFSDDSMAFVDTEEPKDFTPEDLCVLKQMFLDFEKALDAVDILPGQVGSTYDGDYTFELLKSAGINVSNFNAVLGLIDKLVEFLTTLPGDGPFQRKGAGLQLFWDLLNVAFFSVSQDAKEKLKNCFKVHFVIEEPRKKQATNWLSKATIKSNCRVLNYWCFSPGFGMKTLLQKELRCVILTSGTLAPLKPLISELDLNIQVTLENPHIVSDNQLCVRILTKGPDNEPLNCNYQNRDNPKYINSVGRTLLNLIKFIPDGLLVFFPSYPIMQKFQQTWQETGIWGSICNQKQIYVEPKDKVAFNAAMTEYYAKIKDVNLKGAIFMGVCRGKVSEGVDFCDANGRAVVVIGLPFPPLKDPRVVLKKKYLDVCNSKNKEYLRGDDWYSLEAVRAVNQAIGRVIRHRHDYGAILLLDSRFCNHFTQSRLSMWIRGRLKIVDNFGLLIRDLRDFFKNANEKLPQPKDKTAIVEAPKFDSQTYNRTPQMTSDDSSDSSSSVAQSSSAANGEVRIRPRKRKITVVPNPPEEPAPKNIPSATILYITTVKDTLDTACFRQFLAVLTRYSNGLTFEEVAQGLDEIFLERPNDRFVIQGLKCYIKPQDAKKFDEYCNKMLLM